MVFEYLNQSGMLKIPIPSMTLHEIARAVKTEDGTWATDVPSINQFIEEAVPSVEVEDEYRTRKVQEIDEEITAGRPCIPFIRLTDGVHKTWHAIVVSYINIERNEITFNDPGPPHEFSMKLSQFEGLWSPALTTLLKIQIGRNTRTVLTQFGIEPQ